MSNVTFIVIEGPIGAGKTSLAEKIANYFNFYLLKEIVDQNPFLNNFYNNIDKWGFQTEMFFLCSRYKQLEDIKVKYLQHNKPVVSDYHIDKSIIFARRTLNENNLEKFEQIYKILSRDVAVPNIIIYIQTSLDTLLKRIKHRGRNIEQNIEPEYLTHLLEDYNQYIDNFKQLYPHIPIIKVNGDKMDFVAHQQDLMIIIEEVKDILDNNLMNL